MSRFTLHRESRDVLLDGSPVHLTRLEFELLALLANRPYTVITKEEIGRSVWGYSDGSSNRAIESHFNRLRRKLGDFNPIVTKWGVGYMFVPDGVDGDGQPRGRVPESIGAGVIAVLKPNGTVFWVSESVQPLLGWSAAEMRGTGYAEYLHPADRIELEANGGWHAQISASAMRVRLRTRSGEHLDVQAVAEPMMDDGYDRLLGVVHVWTPLS